MKTLNKEAFFSSNLLQKTLVPVEVPELGGRVFVRKMSAKDRLDFEDSVVADGAPYASRVRQALVVCAVCDEAGNRIFTFDDMAEIDKLPFELIENLHKAADDLNLITLAAQERALKN